MNHRFDVASKVPTLGTYLADAEALQTSSGEKYLVQIVIYDLPDVSLTVSTNPLHAHVANNFQSGTALQLRRMESTALLTTGPRITRLTLTLSRRRFPLTQASVSLPSGVRRIPRDTSFISKYSIEPDSLANMVTNLSVEKCANAQSTYEALAVYAWQTLTQSSESSIV